MKIYGGRHLWYSKDKTALIEIGWNFEQFVVGFSAVDFKPEGHSRQVTLFFGPVTLTIYGGEIATLILQ